MAQRLPCPIALRIPGLVGNLESVFYDEKKMFVGGMPGRILGIRKASPADGDPFVEFVFQPLPETGEHEEVTDDDDDQTT